MGCLITWGYEFVFLLLLSAASRINSLPLGWWRSFCHGFCHGLLPSGNGTWQWKIHEKPEFMGNVPSQQKPPWLVRRLPQRWSWWPPGKLWKTWDSLKWCPEQLTFESFSGLKLQLWANSFMEKPTSSTSMLKIWSLQPIRQDCHRILWLRHVETVRNVKAGWCGAPVRNR